MPKTSPDIDNRLAARQHDVRLPRKVAPLKPVAVTRSVEQAAHDQFWFGILAANGRQIPTPGIRDVPEVRSW